MTVSLEIKERGASEMGAWGVAEAFPVLFLSGCFVNVYLRPLPFFNHPSSSVNLDPRSHFGSSFYQY